MLYDFHLKNCSIGSLSQKLYKMEITFSAGGNKFVFAKEKLPINSYFHDIINIGIVPKDNIYALDCTSEELEIVHNYLMKNKIPLYEQLYIFDRFNISELHSYELCAVKENFMRKNIYNLHEDEDNIIKNNYYGLEKITEKFFNALNINTEIPYDKENNMIFENASLKKNNWNTVTKKLSELKDLLNVLNQGNGKAMVAGGKIFNSLFIEKNDNSDFDIFLYGCTNEEAKEKITKLDEYLLDRYDVSGKKARDRVNELFQTRLHQPSDGRHDENDNYGDISDNESDENVDNFDKYARGELTLDDVSNKELMSYSHEYADGKDYLIRRSKNAITFQHCRKQKEYQIILRLYSTPSEILHGFDVDCCSIGYDGENIWITQRALYSVMNGYNTVNFERLSPSYEVRLVKYSTRGMKVYIPGFNAKNVNLDELEKFHNTTMNTEFGPRQSNRYYFIGELAGIDKLLYLNHRVEKFNFNGSTLAAIRNLNVDSSDYSYQTRGGRQGQSIMSIIQFISSNAKEHQSKADRYLPIIKNLSKIINNEYIKNAALVKSNVYDSSIKDNDQLKEMLRTIINYRSLFSEKFTPKKTDCSEIDLDFRDATLTLNSMLGHNKYSELFTTHSVHKASLDMITNSMLSKEFDYVELLGVSDDYHYSVKDILYLPDPIYEILTILKTVNFEKNVTFRTQNPGEQMSNTFNKIVYEDNKEWYKGKFYNLTA